MSAEASYVPRTRDAGLRGELLASIVDYVLAHGLADLSLRPLAKAVGASPRTMLYHFGSKDALVVAILEETSRRQLRLLEAWYERSAEHDARTLLLRAWQWLTAPRHDRLLTATLRKLWDGAARSSPPCAVSTHGFDRMDRTVCAHARTPRLLSRAGRGACDATGGRRARPPVGRPRDGRTGARRSRLSFVHRCYRVARQSVTGTSFSASGVIRVRAYRKAHPSAARLRPRAYAKTNVHPYRTTSLRCDAIIESSSHRPRDKNRAFHRSRHS